MTRIVADASSLIELLLGTRAAASVAAILGDPAVEVCVPALCDVEVASGLRRALLRDALTQRRCRAALSDYIDLPLTRHGHLGLLDRMIHLARNLSAYDATYVALAEMLRAPLVTADARLARAARVHTGVAVMPVRAT